MKEIKNSTVAGSVSRRRFLGYAGGVAGAGLLIASCTKDDEPVIIEDPEAIDLGENDNGLLNLMYVMEQIEAEFYIQAVQSMYTTFSAEELNVFTHVRDQEITHREFLRNYLNGNGPIVEMDFSGIDFENKAVVLEHAELFENLTVGTFNEAGRLFISDNHVSIASKMASVEARHASTMSNLRSPGNFFATVDVIGSEPGDLPANTITTLNRFLITKVSGNNLPNK